MNGLKKNTATVYIYTAVNGYAWQGCDAATADSLDKCIGNKANAGAGGLRRGEVGGLNGTAVYRCHVRSGGDFAGRDSNYIALAFIPFAGIGDRKVDLARLFGHPLLAKPIGHDGSLEDLAIDLSAEGLLEDGGDPQTADQFWTSERSISESGGWQELCGWLGDMAQSRNTELGSFSARLSEKGDGRFSCEVKYKPFGAVTEAVAAKEDYFRKSNSGSYSEKERTEAFEEWKSKLAKLDGLVEREHGAFRHFLGLCEYAKRENDAIGSLMGGQTERDAILNALSCVDRLVKAVDGRLVGDDPILDVLYEMIDEQRQKLPRLGGEKSSLEEAGRRLSERVSELRGQSQSLGKCLRDSDSRIIDPKEMPDRTAPILRHMAGQVLAINQIARQCQAELKGNQSKLTTASERLYRANDELDKARQRIGTLESRRGARKSTTPQIDSGADRHGDRMDLTSVIDASPSRARSKRFWNLVANMSFYLACIGLLGILFVLILEVGFNVNIVHRGRKAKADGKNASATTELADATNSTSNVNGKEPVTPNSEKLSADKHYGKYSLSNVDPQDTDDNSKQPSDKEVKRDADDVSGGADDGQEEQ